MPTAIILLAAGQGSRMKSELPKVLHKIAGAPLLEHALASARAVEPERIVIVTGHGADEVRAVASGLDPDARPVHQAEQLGTGHAVRQAAGELADFDGNVIVLYGDTPFIRPETLQAMLAELQGGAAVVVLGFEAADPGGYGRLLLDADGALNEIVEARDATPEQLAITLCNCGVVAANSKTLFSLLADVTDNNTKGEFYLTDIVAIARSRDLKAAAITCPEAETLGINSRADLASAETTFQDAARASAMENGTTLIDPATVWFSRDTAIGRDVVIAPNVFFGPGATVESGVSIHSFCHLEDCHISRGAQIGPFARLRPGAEIAEKVRVGNFVEIKNAIVEEGAKINHLAYVGDAHVGAGANIGAGAIFCNYDGAMKHHAEVGAGAFIGSNSALVAPVSIGAEAMVAAGSVITADVPDGALAMARCKQENRPGLAIRLMEKLRKIKASRSKI